MTSETPRYRIRVAEEADAGAVVALRRHAEQWLSAAGIEQWTVSTTGTKDILKRVGRGTTYIVEWTAGGVVASLALDDGDPAFWTEEELSQSAVYLYKFIIRSEHRGTGLGEILLDWACDRARRSGIEKLRLDCWRSNLALHKYYRNHGFHEFAIRESAGRMSGALFERMTDYSSAHLSAVTLIDETVGIETFSTPAHGEDSMPSRTDPTGEAAIWEAASQLVYDMRGERIPGDDNDYWNTALEQASRALDVKARQIRMANGL